MIVRRHRDAPQRETTGPIDPLSWLRARRPGARAAFQSRDGGPMRVANGVAAVRPLAALTPGPGERWWIHGRFEGGHLAVLPAIELTCWPDHTEVVRRPTITPAPSGSAAFIPGHAPDYEGWVEGVESVRLAARRGAVEKVVLARQTGFTLMRAVDPVLALARLDIPQTDRFLVDRDGGTFLGATPERLLTRTGDTVWTEALAGTRPRGEGAADVALAQALLDGAKERAEQRLVAEAIERALAPLCDPLQVDPRPHIARYPHVQHLRSCIRGVRRAGVRDADLVAALHPTPAVCGTPTHLARGYIARFEAAPRGGYAAPVGWISADAAEVAVALRCGWVQDRHLVVHVGAGLLAASDPADEWAELDHKARAVREAFGV